MRTVFPDYDHCLINFSSSILKEFDLETKYRTLRDLDRLLKYNYSNIIVLVYEGISSKLIDNELPKDSFLRQHKIRDITSVFPTTRKLSQKSLETGLTALEYGIFSENVAEDKKMTIPLINSPESKDIITLINKNTKYKAYGIYPYGIGKYNNREDMYNRIINLSKNDGKKYIYAYCNSPCESKDINSEIEKLVKELTDSLVLVLSNCGRSNSCKEINLNNYEDLSKLLEKITYIEQRCCFIKIKGDNKEKFVNLFKKYFYNDFRLFTLEEAKSKALFGPSNQESSFSNTSFDYIMISKGEKNLSGSNQHFTYGGISEEEMIVPVFAISRKKTADRENIRRVISDDFIQFKTLANQFYMKRIASRKDIFVKTEAITKNEFFSLCDRFNGNDAFVYIYDEEVLGYIRVELITSSRNRFYKDRAVLRIVELYVLEEHRRKKIATKLYEYVVQYAKKLHVKDIEFFVWNFETETQEFINSLQMKILNQCYEIKI